MTNPLPKAEMKALENIVFGRPMKPETIERRAVKRRREIAERRALHIERLKEGIASGRDTSGLYAEMLAEAEQRQAATLAKL
jgi:hypothetical protein